MWGRINFFVQLFYHSIRKTESLFNWQIFWTDAPTGDNNHFSVYCTITYCSVPEILLPCQWKYWHRAKYRLRDKTEFGMYNPQNVEKSGFGQSVCASICLSVCLSFCLSVLLSLFPRALTGVRFNRSSWNFKGMFGYMGHCTVPIFKAVCEPVYKII